MNAHKAGLQAEALAAPEIFRIGPNAVLQLMPVLDAAFGPGAADLSLRAAGMTRPASDAGMLPETEVAALHRHVRTRHPDEAPRLLRDAGLATGDYILANRIPAPARALIRALPAFLGARLLSAAIARHSWTFAGSGRFRVLSAKPLVFEIAANPMVSGETASRPICQWHAAVFERLFARLVWPDVAVREVACCACGDPACQFELMLGGRR